jgi:hypothetical protein
MKPLLCLLGLHHTEWTAIVPSADDPAWIRGWLSVRRCTRCGHLIRRTAS